jgi:hypothetical protein
MSVCITYAHKYRSSLQLDIERPEAHGRVMGRVACSQPKSESGQLAVGMVKVRSGAQIKLKCVSLSSRGVWYDKVPVG